MGPKTYPLKYSRNVETFRRYKGLEDSFFVNILTKGVDCQNSNTPRRTLSR